MNSTATDRKFSEDFFSSLNNTKGVTCGSDVTVKEGKNKREVVEGLVCSAQIHCPSSFGKMYMSCSLHFLSIASLHNTLHNPENSLHISHITISKDGSQWRLDMILRSNYHDKTG